MKRFYIIAGLLGLIGIIAGGIVFFSPSYRVAYYASTVERDLKEHPAHDLIRLVYPDKIDQDALARAVAEVWIEDGYPAAMFRMELTVLTGATPLVTRSIPNAAPEAVTNYMRLNYDALERLADADPEACGVLTGHPSKDGVQDANMALINVMSEDEKRAYYQALVDIIESANRSPSKIALTLKQTYDFIHQATADAVARMGKERAAKSLGAEPEKPFDPCLIQSYIMKNLLDIDDEYRSDVFKIQMLRGSASRLKNKMPQAKPAGVPPGQKAPEVNP